MANFILRKMKKINQIEPLIDNNDKKAINDYLKTSGWITENKLSSKFEDIFSKIVGCKYSILHPNGTLTLVSILLTLNLKKDDEVIVPNYTMVASANSVILAGAKPIFCDISSENLCLDPQDLLKKINRNTKAVIYVTMNGRSGHIKKIQKICKKNNIKLIEDSAHSLGSYLKNKHHGSFGYASSFSFSMPKIITTGQGGMVCTNSKKIFNQIKKIKNFGRSSDGNDNYDQIGYNFKFTDLQAALGISQIKQLNLRTKLKKDIFKYYYNELKMIDEIQFFNFEKNETPWFIDIYLKNPRKLQFYLKQNGISSRLVYPPLNKQKFFNTKRKLKISEYYCSRGLWLPSSINLTKKNLKYITLKIKEFFKNK